MEKKNNERNCQLKKIMRIWKLTFFLLQPKPKSLSEKISVNFFEYVKQHDGAKYH
jgi:hypothetical protein